MQAMLALEDGRIFRGKGFGAASEARRRSRLQYFADRAIRRSLPIPPMPGQIVVLTNPHIGNYGTTPSDAESAKPISRAW